MIVNMSEKATDQEINHVIERIREAGYQPHVTRGTERTIVAAVGSGRRHEIEALQVAPGVDNVVAIAQPFKLVSRQVRPERSIVKINGVSIGGPDVVVIAGPCSVESREQLLDTAHAVKQAGASMLRGGAYKPRTSPYAFQGLGEEGLKILAEVLSAGLLPTAWVYRLNSTIGEPLFQLFNLIEWTAGAAVVAYGQRGLNAYWASRGGEERVLETDLFALAIAGTWGLLSLIGMLTPAPS